MKKVQFYFIVSVHVQFKNNNFGLVYPVSLAIASLSIENSILVRLMNGCSCKHAN